MRIFNKKRGDGTGMPISVIIGLILAAALILWIIAWNTGLLDKMKDIGKVFLNMLKDIF